MNYHKILKTVILLVCMPYISQAAPLKIVASLSTFADLAETIGGDRVKCTYIAQPNFDPHHITPKPGDVIKLQRADLLLYTGLDLEAWLDSLLDVAGNIKIRHGGERSLSMSQGMELLEVPSVLSRSEGDVHADGNPHFWISPGNALIMANTIALKLQEIDPDGKDVYEDHLQKFKKDLQEKILFWKNKLQKYQKVEFMAYHDQWIYFSRFFDLKIDNFIEVKPGIPPSAKHVVELIQEVRKGQIKGILDATYMPKSSLESMSKKCNLPLCYLCQNVHEIPEASNYISMLDYNVGQIARIPL